jgi:hypothetical protein
LPFFTEAPIDSPFDNYYTNRTRHKTGPPAAAPDNNFYQQPFLHDLARPAALFQHIRYKVIIRICLSVRRFRYMVAERAAVVRPKGRETCPGRRPLS